MEKKRSSHYKFVISNFKDCKQCKVKKEFIAFVSLSKDQKTRRDICRDCEKDNKQKKLIESTTKHCPQCDTTFPKSEFPSDISRIDGLYGICKSCKGHNDYKYKKKNPDKMREITAKRNAIAHNRIAKNLRTRLGKLMKQNKTSSTFDYIGMTISEFREWLEYQFDENMNWDNYGSYWQIDHVTPCASYNLEDENEAFKCFSWENSRPLEKKENNIKSDNIDNAEINKHNGVVLKYKKFLSQKSKNNEIIV